MTRSVKSWLCAFCSRASRTTWTIRASVELSSAVVVDVGFLRCHIKQRPDRGMRAAHREGFERVREREEKHQHRALERLADERGSKRRDDHQEVDVELALLERVPGFLHAEKAAT